MMRVATPEQMREADARTVEGGVSGSSLMEAAGRSAADLICDSVHDAGELSVVVVSGKGNNGGDGFVVARHLASRGASVAVYALAGREGLKGEARAAFEALERAGISVSVLDRKESAAFRSALGSADVVVDALLGTGFSGSLRPPLDRVVAEIGRAPGRIVSLDVPSGVDGLTGAVAGRAVKASVTVTFAAPKLGLLREPGRSHAGRVVTVDIGITAETLDASGVTMHAVTASAMRRLLPARAPDAHKGDAGRVVIAGGSRGMTGAVALAARAALRAGAGLVTAAVPSSLHDILEMKLTEVMTRGCRETTARVFAEDAAEEILELAARADAVALGPGLSRISAAAACAQEVATSARCPVVIDADAINAFERHAAALASADGVRVITPHPGEAARLLGEDVGVIGKDPIAAARRIAEATRAVVVLKGAPTVVCDGTSGGDPDRRPVLVNTTGNAALASGGTGDVLTGVIAGLIAQGSPPRDAAVLGTYLHGAAGDLGRDRLTTWGLIAGDVVELLPEVMGLLDAGEDFSSWLS